MTEPTPMVEPPLADEGRLPDVRVPAASCVVRMDRAKPGQVLVQLGRIDGGVEALRRAGALRVTITRAEP